MRHLIPIFVVFGVLLSPSGSSGAAGTLEDRGCESDEPLFGCPRDGRIYRDSLIRALDTADRVIATEHSDRWDLGPAKGADSNSPETEYRRVELDAAQRAHFRKTLQMMNPATQNWASACMPVIHHTVRFETAGRVSGTLRICFKCSQVFWDGAEVSPPEAIYAALKTVVKRAGLEPERNWSQLALEARDAATPAAD